MLFVVKFDRFFFYVLVWVWYFVVMNCSQSMQLFLRFTEKGPGGGDRITSSSQSMLVVFVIVGGTRIVTNTTRGRPCYEEANFGKTICCNCDKRKVEEGRFVTRRGNETELNKCKIRLNKVKSGAWCRCGVVLDVGVWGCGGAMMWLV
jgi:hypothetical protein